MAIIFNISEAIKQSAFNILQEPIKMLMSNENEAFEKESMIDKIYVKHNLSTYQEEYRTKTSMDNFEPGADMEPAKLSDFQEGYGKVFTSVTWRNSFVISKQTIEDNQMLTISTDAVGFIKSYGRTRELFAFGMLGGALEGSYTSGKYKFDCRGMDTVDGKIDGTKQLYFHKLHRSPVNPGSNADGSQDQYAPQSNKFYCKIDLKDAYAHRKLLSAIGQVQSAMMNYYDYKGNPLQVNPTVILIPNHYEFRNALLTALKTTNTDVLGNNGVNLQVGQWTVLTSVYLNSIKGFTAADQALIMIDPKVNRDNLGAVWLDRVPLEVTSYYEELNEANIWKGRARYSAAFGDFRAMAYLNTGASSAPPNSTTLTIGDVPDSQPVNVVGTVTTKAGT